MDETVSLSREVEHDLGHGTEIVEDLQSYGISFPNHGISMGNMELMSLNIIDADFVKEYVADSDSVDEDRTLATIKKLLCGEEVAEDEKIFLAKCFDVYRAGQKKINAKN